MNPVRPKEQPKSVETVRSVRLVEIGEIGGEIGSTDLIQIRRTAMGILASDGLEIGRSDLPETLSQAKNFFRFPKCQKRKNLFSID